MTSKEKPIPVLEIFGPTVQGEGLVIGQKTMFVRTAGCDYSCSWCDSSFTWDGSAKNEIKQLSAQMIWDELKILGGNTFEHVTISGGNPALLKNIGYLVNLLHDQGIRVGLETQGSRWQEWMADIDDLTISPKPPSSGMITDWEKLDEVMENLKNSSNEICIKVVVFDEDDLQYAVQAHKRYPHIRLVLQVGNSDVTTLDREGLAFALLEKYEWLINQVMASSDLRQVKVLPQLHTLLWGNKRGV
ncbi:preQ(0) biosynthesis protein QueE [Fontibacillus panacisegetis]|uniref:7-carboxy-7-deazaguanine synthase n=1 Tax=Fontibacillus panacisegetis TaxID=670482 RepID=A0A1G7GVH9_9BACL|nr:7-carboxy-7-deazaguanine synthase QueE [Fontibacillus panacisegetis]SDE92125.1 preQ(0) biosynthesis protein QueE [Fontibacillus panacisegetis]